MKVRLLAALGITATIGVAVAPAQATPYAGQYDYLAAHVQVHGADGATWQLALVATRPGVVGSRPEQRLYVDLDRCVAAHCTAVGRWAQALQDADLTVSGDLATGALRTRVLGVPLQVALTGGTGPYDELGFYFDSLNLSVGTIVDQTGAAPSAGRERVANGTVRLGSANCAAQDALLGQEAAVDTLGDDVRDPRTAPPARLPAGFLSGKRSARC